MRGCHIDNGKDLYGIELDGFTLDALIKATEFFCAFFNSPHLAIDDLACNIEEQRWTDAMLNISCALQEIRDMEVGDSGTKTVKVRLEVIDGQ